jgi:hypothetical protein
MIAMAQPPATAILAAISFVFIPPFETPEMASPAIASIRGVIAPTRSNRCAVGSSLGLAE